MTDWRENLKQVIAAARLVGKADEALWWADTMKGILPNVTGKGIPVLTNAAEQARSLLAEAEGLLVEMLEAR